MASATKWWLTGLSLATINMVWSGISTANSYLCEAESATGFVYDKKRDHWQSSQLVAANKYLISPVATDDLIGRALKFDHEVRMVDSEKPLIHCKTARFADSNEESGMMYCRGTRGASFTYNKRTGKYIRSDLAGYVEIEMEASEVKPVPFIEIGKCSPM